MRFPAGREPRIVGAPKEWLDTWPGVGRIVLGMARQGYDVQVTRYGGHGWRATFFLSGVAHSLTSAVGTGWAGAPWHAVQRAARSVRS